MNGIEDRISNLDLLDGIVKRKDKKLSKIYDNEPSLEEDNHSEDYPDFPSEYRRRSLSDGKLEQVSSAKSEQSVSNGLPDKESSKTGETQTNNKPERKPLTKIRYRTRRASHYHVQWAGETVIKSEEEGDDDMPRQRSYSDASHQRVKLRSILKYPRQEKPTCIVFVHAD